jgi:hypothetical protein
MEEGIYPRCQYPTDVFPLRDVEYLERNQLDKMVITGFGRQRKYVLVSFHAEERNVLVRASYLPMKFVPDADFAYVIQILRHQLVAHF